MKVRFWGVRGSIPVPGANTVHFGGNTTCFEVTTNAGKTILLDCGTGLRSFGEELMARQKPPYDLTIFISHTHWDHIHGFPFFTPAYIPGTQIRMYGPFHYEKRFEEVMQVQMSYSYFPVEMSELGAQIQYFDLKEGEFEVDGVKVQTKLMNHPILTLGYRITDGDKVFVYTGDNEPYYNFFDGADASEAEKVNAVVAEQNQSVVEFCKGADLLICDAQYTEAEYEKKRGWGHNSKTHALEIARKSGCKRMAMWHHEPVHTDKQLLELEQQYQERAKKLGMTCEVFEAREGTTIEF